MIINPNKTKNERALSDEKNKELPAIDASKPKTSDYGNYHKKNYRLSAINGERREGNQFRIKTLVYAVLILIGCVFLGMASILTIIGPLVTKEKSLPIDFPASIPLYLSGQASIKSQNPEQTRKLRQIMDSLPDWFITPFLSRLSVDPKTQILLGNEKEKIYDSFSFKKSLETNPEELTFTSLKWKKINKTRGVLREYYVNKLKSAGFFVSSEDRNQETLIFFSNFETKGIFFITDNFASAGSSDISLTVSY